MTTATLRFKHNYRFTTSKGRTKIQCTCGKQSPWLEMEELVKWANTHTLNERKRHEIHE